jgi:hypothetical protein
MKMKKNRTEQNRKIKKKRKQLKHTILVSMNKKTLLRSKPTRRHRSAK